ncbi:hypothetical protein Ciccas_007585 [Cichlidogyrus casuarinus]|uniref:HMG box domain-containing protein n=1 Tax=Cichlidogyrus casuarinus TaxID=1844966 RepID=A0ABD2Q2G9_9PLAT
MAVKRPNNHSMHLAGQRPDKVPSKKPHIKKPLNAFMLFMKEMRAKVQDECTLKESAAINQILGKKWHELPKEEQARFYELAREEKEKHSKLYPGWSARDNYAMHSKRKKRRRMMAALSAAAVASGARQHPQSNQFPTQQVPAAFHYPPPPQLAQSRSQNCMPGMRASESAFFCNRDFPPMNFHLAKSATQLNTSEGETHQEDEQEIECSASHPKKCRARFGLEQQNRWCKPCRRKKKCIRWHQQGQGDDCTDCSDGSPSPETPGRILHSTTRMLGERPSAGPGFGDSMCV